MTVALRRAPTGIGVRRRVAMALGAVVALLGGAFLLGPLAADRGGAPAPAATGGESEPSVGYAITYRVVHDDGTEVDEHIEVARPFRSAVRAGETERVSDLGLLATVGGDGQWVRIEVPVAIASGDLRPDAVLAAAVEAGHVEVGDEHRVAGVTCREHRFGGPVSSGMLTPVGSVSGEHADVCLDGRGLVLRERWVVGGRTLRERTAVAIDLRPPGDARFTVPDGARSLSVEAGGGSVVPVAGDHDPGFAERWSIDPPEGFDHVGRWVVLPPSLERREPGTPRTAQIALVTDAWQRGGDLVLLDQGATVAGVAPPWDERPVTTRADLDSLGTAEIAWDLRATEVRLVRPDGGFVRVAGTLPPAELVALARTLVPLEPGAKS